MKKKNIVETKKKILDALEDKKEFDVMWVEEITYSKTITAKNEEEIREMFDNGEIVGENEDINDMDFVEDSLEIEECED